MWVSFFTGASCPVFKFIAGVSKSNSCAPELGTLNAIDILLRFAPASAAVWHTLAQLTELPLLCVNERSLSAASKLPLYFLLPVLLQSSARLKASCVLPNLL